MMKKRLHMIGNSHIDPVWFWQWEEGMQEVHATFRSALDRMNEFPDFRFTATSAAFFAYLEQIDPGMLDEIRRRVAEGRFELTGGWWIEPDCNQPRGESFARQALYGQRTFKRLFGRTARIGSNVDSFGHDPQLPQLLRQGGLEGYLFLRPNVAFAGRELTPGRIPAFRWDAPDGSSIPAVSLPGEYTTWFKESARENIRKTLDAMGDLPTLPCCYGVGNHGGGPTIANIHAIHELAEEFPEAELRFSTVGDSFDDLVRSAQDLPHVKSYFDHINAGCYSVDHRLKQKLREAEYALLRAEKLMVIARMICGEWKHEDTAPLWERLLFNQFHDTMGGTIIEEAHDDALNDVGGVIHQANIIANLAMHAAIAGLRIEGQGVPIFLFNLSEKPWTGIADVELNWFCNSDLRLKDSAGKELPYARVKQSCTMVWLHLGGRRRILFRASIPAFGVRVYFADDEPATLRLPVAYEGDAHTLDNGLVRLELNERGEPVHLIEHATGYDALRGACRFNVWHDDRDPWGGNGHSFEPLPQEIVTDSVDRVETSDLRQVLRVRRHAQGLRVETHYALYAGEKTVRMDCRLMWDQPWHQLRFTVPAQSTEHICESAFGVMSHGRDDDELFMHRFVDALRESGSGLAITGDSISAFQPRDGETDLLILRSPIYAQGADRTLWMHDHDSYHYMDLGDHHFTLTLTPHGKAIDRHELFRLADLHEQGTCYLVGGMTERGGTHDLPYFGLSAPSVRLEAAKKAEDNEAIILRLHETDQRPAVTDLTIGQKRWTLSFRPCEVKTVRIDGEALTETNFLEFD